MSVPLTLRHRLVWGTHECKGCGHVGSSYRSEFTCAGGTYFTDPYCTTCLPNDRSPEVVVLDPPSYQSGSAAPSRAMKKKAQRRERKVAAAIGGRTQPASGAMAGAKGDVRLKGKWRIDDKTCRNKGFALTRQIINKIRSECSYGENFAITVGFLDPLTQQDEDNVVVIDRYVWEEYVNAGNRS